MAVIIFAGISISPVVSSLMDSVVIGSNGQIYYESNNVYASSGSAVDIQAAIDQVVAQGGKGSVHIPAGTFNFVEVGEPWQTVNIPAGVSLFGASNNRDADGQNTEWRTVLVMPWDVPSGSRWFAIEGTGDETVVTRFSDIKLQGYRSTDSSSVTLHYAIRIDDVRDFRIDHCNFEHTTNGIFIWGVNSRGVIDHNRLVNFYGFDNLGDYTASNIMYGVRMGRGFYSTGYGYDALMNVLGKYTDYSVYIEDNYFSKWRHCISSNHGAHYVFRYNTIENDFGHFSLDVHGLRDLGEGRWGTRAAEIYENRLINAVPTDFRTIFQNGGGSGVWFNNYIDSSYRNNGIVLYSEDAVTSETWHLKDFYLWSTKGSWVSSWSGIPSGFTADRNVLADWNREAYDPSNPLYPNVDPTWSIAGYKPYTYPHPLTLIE
ncbi:MAG: hypothetical protein ACFFDI_17570 [Promethearchaeota archaeon]